MTELSEKRCLACEGGVATLNVNEIKNLLTKLDNWEVVDNKELQKTIRFKDYYGTMAFVNAVAWIAHNENHHPDLEVSYNHIKLRYSTHAVNGLTENDFICAAKVDRLLQQD